MKLSTEYKKFLAKIPEMVQEVLLEDAWLEDHLPLLLPVELRELDISSEELYCDFVDDGS